MPKFFYCEQGSEEWFRLRMGKPTASEMHRILTPSTLSPSGQRLAYMNRLLCEWALDTPIIGDYESDFMAAGKENEPMAADGFAFIKDVELTKVGFVLDTTGLWGCSPDRIFADEKKAVEIKCPANHTHIGYLIDKSVLTDKYVLQVQSQYASGEFEEIWMTSWAAKLPQRVIHVPRDETMIAKIETRVIKFCEEMLQKREFLASEYGLPVIPEPRAKSALIDALELGEDDIEWLTKEYLQKEGESKHGNETPADAGR